MSVFDMSFKEKSIWASCFIILLVYGKYFLYVFDGLSTGSLDKGDIPVELLCHAVVLLPSRLLR